MPKCKNDSKRNYTGKEPSPKGLGWGAHAEKEGKRRKGKDGKSYVVASRANGSLYWKLVASKTSGAKKSKPKKSTTKSASSKKQTTAKTKKSASIERVVVNKKNKSEFLIKPVTMAHIRKLNKLAECTDRPVKWTVLEKEYPRLQTIRDSVTRELVAIGVYLFVVPNDSGWADAPDDEVDEAFRTVALEEDPKMSKEKRKSLYYMSLGYPCITGNLVIDSKTNHPRDAKLWCGHCNITEDKHLKQQVIDIFKRLLGSAFEWNGTKTRNMLLKLK